MSKEKTYDETADIEFQLDRMASQRQEILHGAQDLTSFLENFEKGFSANSIEEFPNPEQMDTLLQDIEFQREKSLQALMEISKSMDKLGHTSSTDLAVDDELELEPKEVKRIGEDHNKGVNSLAAKLVAIFSKSKKYYNDVLHSFATDGLDLDSDVKTIDNEANVEQALIPMLQQKIVHLKKDIDLSRVKSQSMQVQWNADKIRYEDMLAHVKQEINTLTQKLVVADSKKRFREQTERDENMVVESVSRVEYNHVVMELEAMRLKVVAGEMEVLEKKVVIDQLNNEIQLKAMDITNLDRKVSNLEQRLELATQAKDHFQKKLDESVTVFEGKFNVLRDQLDKQRHDHNDTLDENSRLKREVSGLQDQISTLKRENDEFFKFLHKAEEDNKMLRSLASDVQAKLGPALAEKEDMEKKLNAKLLDYNLLQVECDNHKGQLWKVINSLKSFSKSNSRTLNSSTTKIEDKLLEQQERLSSLEAKARAMGVSIGEHYGAMRKQRDVLRRDQRKRDMLQQYADSKAASPEIPDDFPSLDVNIADVEIEENDAGFEYGLSSEAIPVPGQDIDYISEYNRLKQLDEKKTIQLQRKEADLVSCRKNMELQRNAMDSQNKVMESQKKSLSDKLDEVSSSMGSIQAQLKVRDERIIELQTEILFEKQIKERLQIEMDEMGLKNIQLIEEMRNLRDELDEAHTEINRLIHCNEELQIKNQEQDLQIADVAPVNARSVMEADSTIIINTNDVRTSKAAPTLSVAEAPQEIPSIAPQGQSCTQAAQQGTNFVRSDVRSADEANSSTSLPNNPSWKVESSPSNTNCTTPCQEFGSATPVCRQLDQVQEIVEAGLPELLRQVNENVDIANISNSSMAEVVATVRKAVEGYWIMIKESINRSNPIEIADGFSNLLQHISHQTLNDAVKSVSQLSENTVPVVLSLQNIDVSAINEENFANGNNKDSSTFEQESASLHSPTPEEKQKIQEEMFQDGSNLDMIHKVRLEDFDWLVSSGFADHNIAELAKIEYQLLSEDNEVEARIDELERNKIRLLNLVIRSTSFRTLSKYYKMSMDRYSLMKTFSTWKSIQNYKDGGIFLDTLLANIQAIKFCIAAKGGWKEALTEIIKSQEYMQDTSVWPDFFRIRVLELFRELLTKSHNEENEKLKSSISQLEQAKQALESTIATHQTQRRPSLPRQINDHPRAVGAVGAPHGHGQGLGHLQSRNPHHHSSDVSADSYGKAADGSSLLDGSRAAESSKPAEANGLHADGLNDHLSGSRGRHSRLARGFSRRGLTTVNSSSNQGKADFAQEASAEITTDAAESRTGQQKAADDGREKELSPRSVRDTILTIANERSRLKRAKSRYLPSVREEKGFIQDVENKSQPSLLPLPSAPPDGGNGEGRREIEGSIQEQASIISISTGNTQPSIVPQIDLPSLPNVSAKRLSSNSTVIARRSAKQREAYQRQLDDSSENPNAPTTQPLPYSQQFDASCGSDNGRDVELNDEELEAEVRAALVRKKELLTRSTSVKVLTKEKVVKQMSVRDLSNVLEPSSSIETDASNLEMKEGQIASISGKLSTALSAVSSVMEAQLSEIRTSDPAAVVQTMKAVVFDEATGIKAKSDESKGSKFHLHKLADDVGFLFLSGDGDSEVLIEIILEAIDCWLEGYDSQAKEMLAAARDYCEYPEEFSLIDALEMCLCTSTASGDINPQIYEIFDKFNSMLSIKDILCDLEEQNFNLVNLHNSRLEPSISSSRKSPVINSNGSRSSSRMSTNRGASPEQMDALKWSLQENRIKRLQDREDAHNITANMKEHVAAAIAEALAAAAKECVDIAVQTDLGIDFQTVVDGTVVNENVVDGENPVEEDEESEVNMELVSANPTFSTIMAPLPPGFQLVRINDGQLELCPGVYLASYTRLTVEERATLPRGIAYCFREQDAAYTKGLRRVPRYVVGVPRIPNCEAILVPRIFNLNEDVSLIMDISLQPFTELPPDVYVIQAPTNCVLPDGLNVVNLSSLMEIPSSIEIPSGLELVQVNLAVSLPAGVMLSPECEIMPIPKNLPPLPHNIHLIKRQLGAQLPSFMTLLATTSKDETELILHSKMEDGCAVLKKPMGIDFPLGVELLNRPAGHPMPAGMSPIPSWQFPRQLRLTGTLELVSLTPRFDFPSECRPAPNWVMFPRPTGLRLPPHTHLIQYEGDRGGGILPQFMRRVPMPDIPYGCNIPKNVIAIEFLPGARPLPIGTELCPGVVIVSAKEGVSAVAQKPGSEKIDVDDIVHTLPINAVLVRRKKGSPIPADIERASGGSLPAGILLAPNVEIWLLGVRFELPAGVKLEPGATLGRFTQFSPGTILSRDLEVLEWPRGLRLAIGNELVRLSPNCDMPVGYVQVAYSRSELQMFGLGRDCFIVRLPHVLRLPSTQQLSEAVVALTPEELCDRHVSNENNSNSSKLLSVLQSAMWSGQLPPGSIFIMRDSKRYQLPAEMQAIPKSSLSHDLRTALSDHNVAFPNDIKQDKTRVGSKSEKQATTKKSSQRSGKMKKNTISVDRDELPRKPEKTYFDVAQLIPQFRFPPGVELAPGIVVQERPFYLNSLPNWIELVKVSPERQAMAKENSDKLEFGQKLLSRLKYLRCSPRTEINPYLGSKYVIPEGMELIIIPEDLQVYSWGSNVHGIEAVIQPQDLFLPVGHFLVERPRKSEPPPGLEMGFASHFKKLLHQYNLPPGIEVMHIVPSFYLPMGINILSTDILQDAPQTVSPHTQLILHTSISGNSVSAGVLQESNLPIIKLQPIQLSFGQFIGGGAMIIGNPVGYKPMIRLSDAASSLFPTSLSSEESTQHSTIKQCHAFVLIDPHEYCLPEGAVFHPESDFVVNQYFHEYPNFLLDHAVYQKQLGPKHHRKRRASFEGEEAPATIRRRSLKVLDKDDEASLHGLLSVGDVFSQARPPSEKTTTAPTADGTEKILKITDLIKVVVFGDRIPAPRDRFREQRVEVVDSDSEEQEDHSVVHARITLLSAASANANVERPGQETTESSAVDEASDSTSVQNSPKSKNTAGNTDTDVEANLPETTAIDSNSQNNEGVTDGTIGFEAPPRPHVKLRMGFTMGTMAVEGGKAPDVPTLIQCLEQAQVEIDQLENENNSYRFKTTTAAREIDYLKSKLDRMTATHKNRQEEFQTVRDKISELKGTIANLNKTIELRDVDTVQMRQRYEETIERLRAQVDILTTQVAHWNAASSDIVELTAKHQKQIARLHQHFQKRVRVALDEVLGAMNHLSDVLLQSLKNMLAGVMSDVKFKSIISAANVLPVFNRHQVLFQAVSDGNDASCQRPRSGQLALINEATSNKSNLHSAAVSIGSEDFNLISSKSDEEFLGAVYVSDNSSSTSNEFIALSGTFLDRLGGITTLFTGLKDACSGRNRKSKFAAKDHAHDTTAGQDEGEAIVAGDGPMEAIESTGEEHEERDDDTETSASVEQDDENGSDEAIEALFANDPNVTKEVVDKMNKLSDEIKPMMQGWVDDVVTTVKNQSKSERAVYFKGLQLADAEAFLLNRRIRSLQIKIQELESKLIDSQMSSGGGIPDSFALHEKIFMMQSELDRMHSQYSDSITAKLRQESEEYMDAHSLEQALRFQILNIKMVVANEDKLLDSHKLPHEEVVSIRHRKQKLMQQLNQYEERLSQLEASKLKLKEGILSDIEVFQTLVNQVIPNDVIKKILTWSNVHEEESRMKDIVSQKIAELSPNNKMRPPIEELFSEGQDDSSVSNKSAASLSLKSDFLESAHKSLALPNHKLKYGSTGTMPPAPTRSVFNLSNVLAPKGKSSGARPKASKIVQPYASIGAVGTELPAQALSISIPMPKPMLSNTADFTELDVGRIRPKLKPVRPAHVDR